MEDTFNIEVKIPDFVKLLGEEGKNQILEEVKKKVDKDVSNIVVKAARELMAEKLILGKAHLDQYPQKNTLQLLPLLRKMNPNLTCYVQTAKNHLNLVLNFVDSVVKS